MAPKKRVRDATAAFEAALTASQDARYVLRLYVTGMTPRSANAIANIKEICETHLNGRYDLEVIDVYQRPELAAEAQVVALPTLVKHLPVPLRRMIGDLTDRDRVLMALDIKPRAT